MMLGIGMFFYGGTMGQGSGVPANALLTEDGLPILTEDGDFILIE